MARPTPALKVRERRIARSRTRSRGKDVCRKREKAGGRYATGLLLQLPAAGVRFRCNSWCKADPGWLAKS
jgi:hypothetical protein